MSRARFCDKKIRLLKTKSINNYKCIFCTFLQTKSPEAEAGSNGRPRLLWSIKPTAADSRVYAWTLSHQYSLKIGGGPDWVGRCRGPSACCRQLPSGEGVGAGGRSGNINVSTLSRVGLS